MWGSLKRLKLLDMEIKELLKFYLNMQPYGNQNNRENHYDVGIYKDS